MAYKNILLVGPRDVGFDAMRELIVGELGHRLVGYLDLAGTDAEVGLGKDGLERLGSINELRSVTVEHQSVHLGRQVVARRLFQLDDDDFVRLLAREHSGELHADTAGSDNDDPHTFPPNRRQVCADSTKSRAAAFRNDPHARRKSAPL
jgi:hypothetical protein